MAAPTRTTKSIENYTGEGPKWRLGELFHTSRATILIVMQSMHRMVWPDANKPPAGARGPRSRRASCVSAPTRFSNERIGGTSLVSLKFARPHGCTFLVGILARRPAFLAGSYSWSCRIAAISGTDMDRARLTPMQGLRNQVPNPRPQGRH
jgi:hypothetical protein